MNQQITSGMPAQTKPSRAVPIDSLLLVGLYLSLSISLALMLTLFLLGRANPFHATRVWLGTIVVLSVMIAIVQLRHTIHLHIATGINNRQEITKSLWIGLVYLILTVSVIIAVYVSDAINQVFSGDLIFRRNFLLAMAIFAYAFYVTQGAFLYQAIHNTPILPALQTQLQRHAPLITATSLLALGVSQGTSYVVLMGDDYSRFWAVADSFSSGSGYSASDVGVREQSSGMSRYLIEHPGLPLFLIASFKILGHTVLGAMAPIIIAHILFPAVAYFAFKELLEHRLLSYIAAALLSLFPLFSFYGLRSAEPDPIFLLLLAALAFFAMKCDYFGNKLRLWPILGLIAGLTALTRPEGIMYAGTVMVFLLPLCIKSLGYWFAAIIFGGIVGAFALLVFIVFGVIWPSSHFGAMQLNNLGESLDLLIRIGVPTYAAALGFPVPVFGLFTLGLLVLFALGSYQLAKSRPQLLFLTFLPIMNTVGLLLVTPVVTKPHVPYDFFRHWSYALPFFSLVVAFPIASLMRNFAPRLRERQALIALFVIAVIFVSYEIKLISQPELIYENGTQILTAETYLLASDLLEKPYDLPIMTFEKDGRTLIVSRSFNYMAFRTGLNNFYSTFDLHGSDRAKDYPLAAFIAFLIGLTFAAICGQRNGRLVESISMAS